MKKISRSFMYVLLTLVVTLGVVPPFAAQAAADEVTLTSAHISGLERGVLNIVNRERLAAGLLPLATFPRLQEAARIRAVEARDDLRPHVRPDGTGWATVLPEVGIHNALGGENLASGSVTTAHFAMELWRTSPAHWGNIMNPRHRHLGVGYSPRSWDHRWAQIFVDGEITGITVPAAFREIIIPFGARIEETGAMLILHCALHGRGYLPILSEMLSPYNNMSPVRQAVTVRYGSFTATFHVTPSQAPPISAMFPDPGLAEAVANLLTYMQGRNISVNDTATPAALSGMQTFDIGRWTDTPVLSLEGIHHLPEVRVLTINSFRTMFPLDEQGNDTNPFPGRRHAISCLAPLTRMEHLLRFEVRASNDIVCLGYLSQIPGLVSLSVSRSLISDITPLSQMHNLVQLRLDHNPMLYDLTPISGLISLEGLEISDTAVTDLSPISRLYSLRIFTAERNGISDISPLSGLRSLTNVRLGSNNIADVSPLAALPSLNNVSLNNNQITNIEPLRGRDFRTFNVAHQRITLEPVYRSDSIRVPNMAVTAPSSISNNGTFDAARNEIVWNNLPGHVTSVSYNFNEGSVQRDDGMTTFTFHGRVTQPIINP